MKQIDVSTPTYPNTFALVDDKDYEEISKHKWTVDKCRGKFYAKRKTWADGKQKKLLMHVVIMGKIDNKEIDHRNGNGLNNQRHNLRHCTHAENCRNQDIYSSNTSGYKGVSWDSRTNKWKAYVKYSRKQIHLGYFTCLIKAAKAYDSAAKKHYGEYAKFNFEKG